MKRAILLLGLGLGLSLAACNAGGKIEPRGDEGAFTSDGPAEGPSVFLRGRGDDKSIDVDVIAKGTPDVNGVALRVIFDPEALDFTGATASGAWSRTSVALAKEGTPGQIAVAWAEKGATGFSAQEETVLGTLNFTRKTKGKSTITLRPERSSVVDRKGVTRTVTFRGGSVPAR